MPRRNDINSAFQSFFQFNFKGYLASKYRPINLKQPPRLHLPKCNITEHRGIRT
ncbi:Uncharacterised protein [Leclercia adecarboxylata]|uniref:Uncharacterized protein n=1 Tax=Leclercia adecarboxylata TaxID=83655 RepID=A0A4U9HRI8_9ENTR|nr:Uncharacterised protein [Leclercia adecarboxylata]